MSSLQATNSMPPSTTEQPTTVADSSCTKQQLEWHTTSGMAEGSASGPDTKDTKERNVTAFYNVVWPILEKEGGWTLVRILIFCFIIVCLVSVKRAGSVSRIKSWTLFRVDYHLGKTSFPHTPFVLN